MRRPLRHAVLAAFVVALVIFILLPLLVAVLSSFNPVAYTLFPPPGLSLRWYANLAQQSSFYGAAWRSLWIGVASSALALAVGLAASWALVRSHARGATWWNSFFLSPIVMPKLVLGVAAYIFFVRIHLYGSMLTVVLVHAVVSLPFIVAILTTNIAGLDPALEEAAMDLGAPPRATFLRVIVPQLQVAMLIGGLFAFINSFDQFETTLFLVQTGTTTLPIEMFNYMQKFQDPTVAALSTVIIGFSVGIVILAGTLLGKTDVTQALGRQGRGAG